jgi:hypothetical protein
MKAFLVLLAVVAIASATTQTRGLLCNATANLACLSAGTACGLASTSCPTCPCDVGLVCLSGKCQGVNIGAACTLSTDCVSAPNSLPVTCLSGTCQQVRVSMFAAGDSCNVNSDCVNSLNCTGGKCQGKASGATCIVTAECSAGLYCAAGTCAALKATGTSCASDAECTYICNQGTCANFGSVSSGGGCSEQSACADGLYCNPITSTCVAPTNAGVSCDTDPTICTTGSGCVCSLLTGKATCISLTESCTSNWNSASNCAKSNGCQSGGFYPGACLYDKCASPVGCLMNCEASYAYSIASSIPGCNPYKYNTCDGSVVFANLFVMAAFALLAVFAL